MIKYTASMDWVTPLIGLIRGGKRIHMDGETRTFAITEYLNDHGIDAHSSLLIGEQTSFKVDDADVQRVSELLREIGL